MNPNYFVEQGPMKKSQYNYWQVLILIKNTRILGATPGATTPRPNF